MKNNCKLKIAGWPAVVTIVLGGALPMMAVETPVDSVAVAMEQPSDKVEKKDFRSRWNFTGYAEISALRNFDRLGNRRSNPTDDYSAWELHLPMTGLWIEFDCGKGWTVGTEMHFENMATVAMNGPGTAASREVDWALNFELAEFWIQKSFSEKANIKVGWISTPVGQTNDLPTDFFGITRPEEGPAFLPLDCSAAAIDFNGVAGDWGYEVMAIPGLTGYDFGNSSWRYGKSVFEQSLSRVYAGAFRLTNTSVKGLEMALSGEFGGGYTMAEIEEEDSRKITNGLYLAAFGASYNDHNVIARGSFQYGYLSNHCDSWKRIEDFRHDMHAMSAGAEVGYDMFALNSRLRGQQKFYLFGRYAWRQSRDYVGTASPGSWNVDQRVSFGVNWMPIPSIVVKGECGFGFGADPTRCFAGVSVGWCPF